MTEPAQNELFDVSRADHRTAGVARRRSKRADERTLSKTRINELLRD
jgi:hypothetical protein